MTMPITQHFGLSEFSCHDGTTYPAQWIDERLKPLCDVLEIIRAACGGRPITITSGYRTEEYNVQIGGAAHSQHCLGRAADIEVEGMAPSDVHAIILDLDAAKSIEIGGLGIYPSWCHVDIRERPADGHLAQWTGGGIGAEQAS